MTGEEERALLVRMRLSRMAAYGREALATGEGILGKRDRERIQSAVEEVEKIRARLIQEET